MRKNIVRDSINCLGKAQLEDTTYKVARDITLCYLQELEEEYKELEEENKKLKNLPFIQYQKAILKITEVLDTKSIFIRKKKIKKILEEYYYENN